MTHLFRYFISTLIFATTNRRFYTAADDAVVRFHEMLRMRPHALHIFDGMLERDAQWSSKTFIYACFCSYY